MDDSAACGLLWLRRSIHFFVELVDASVENDKRPPASLVKPAQEAYSRSLASFHTFTTRAFFRTLLSMLPNSEAYMPALMTPMYQSGMILPSSVVGSGSSPETLEWRETVREARAFVRAAKKTLRVWKDLHLVYDMEDTKKY